MIEEFGYKLDRNKGRINDSIKNILFNMEELNLITKLNESKYDVDYKINFFNVNNKGFEENYTLCKNSEISRLKNTKLEYLILLKLYLYIKGRIWVREEGLKLDVVGGKAESGFPSYKLITEEIGLATATIKKYIEELVRLNMIRYGNCGSYYKKDNPKGAIDTPNHYVLYDENGNWELELKESLKLQKKNILDKGFIFTKSNDKKSLIRSINGKKGYLKKQLNQGKITENEYQEEILKLTNK